MLSFVILDKHLSSTKNVPRQAHSALEAAHLVPLLTELYTKLGHPRAPWLMQSCKWCKNTSPKNELLIAMVKAVSDGRLPPLGRKKKKIRCSWVYGLLSPSAETCNAPALGDTAQAALSHLDKPGAVFFQTPSAGALSRVLSRSAAVLLKCSALHCVFSLCFILYFPTLLHVFQCNFRLLQRGISSEPLAVWFFQVMDLSFHKCGKLSCTPF